MESIEDKNGCFDHPNESEIIAEDGTSLITAKSVGGDMPLLMNMEKHKGEVSLMKGEAPTETDIASSDALGEPIFSYYSSDSSEINVEFPDSFSLQESLHSAASFDAYSDYGNDSTPCKSVDTARSFDQNLFGEPVFSEYSLPPSETNVEFPDEFLSLQLDSLKTARSKDEDDESELIYSEYSTEPSEVDVEFSEDVLASKGEMTGQNVFIAKYVDSLEVIGKEPEVPVPLEELPAVWHNLGSNDQGCLMVGLILRSFISFIIQFILIMRDDSVAKCDIESSKSETENESSALKTSKINDDDSGLDSATFSMITTRSIDSVLESLSCARLSAGGEAPYGDSDLNPSLSHGSSQEFANLHSGHQEDNEESRFKNRYVRMGEMLTDDLINAYCDRLQEAVNREVDGMLAMQYIMLEPQLVKTLIRGNKPICQVIYDIERAHYLVVYRGRGRKAPVTIFDPIIPEHDAIHRTLNKSVRRQIAVLFRHLYSNNEPIEIAIETGLSPQQDSWSCGLRAIAHVTHIVLGIDPVRYEYDLESVREFFSKILDGLKPNRQEFLNASLGKFREHAKSNLIMARITRSAELMEEGRDSAGSEMSDINSGSSLDYTQSETSNDDETLSSEAAISVTDLRNGVIKNSYSNVTNLSRTSSYESNEDEASGFVDKVNAIGQNKCTTAVRSDDDVSCLSNIRTDQIRQFENCDDLAQQPTALKNSVPESQHHLEQ